MAGLCASAASCERHDEDAARAEALHSGRTALNASKGCRTLRLTKKPPNTNEPERNQIPASAWPQTRPLRTLCASPRTESSANPGCLVWPLSPFPALSPPERLAPAHPKAWIQRHATQRGPPHQHWSQAHPCFARACPAERRERCHEGLSRRLTPPGVC